MCADRGAHKSLGLLKSGSGKLNGATVPQTTDSVQPAYLRQVNTMEFAFYVAYFPISLASFKTHSVGSELAPLDLRVAPSRIEPTKFSIQGKCKFSCGGIISDPSGCTR